MYNSIYIYMFYMWVIYEVDVGKYSLHGGYGNGFV